jgi:hypothetical protein
VDRTPTREFALDALHILGLSGLAVAQPLYDLVGRHAGFLVAHHATPRTIFALVAALSLGAPAALVAVELLAAPAGIRLHRALHSVIVSVLLLAFAGALSVKAGLAAPVAVTASAFAAVAATLAYRRIQSVRRFFTVFAIAALAFPVAFVATGPVSRLAFPKAVPVEGLARAPESPVVFVLFDELSTFALLDEHGRIDAAQYPSFARLASGSWWFPNAMATHPYTGTAVPVLLTGRIVHDSDSRVPVAADYPRNLFTWLGGSYRMHVMEPVTAMCPSSLCGKDSAQPPPDTRVISTDLAILYAHVVLPASLAARVAPPIGTTWTNFGQGVTPVPAVELPAATATFRVHEQFNRSLERGRAELFREFVRDVDGGGRSVLHYVHVSLPHQPYQYLPSGHVQYRGAIPAEGLGDDDVWSKDEALVLTGEDQYRQQVRFSDRLLGELLDRLRALDVYDRALVIVTSDHGAAFVPGQSHRTQVNRANYRGIAAVPLFVKLPHQTMGMVSERPTLGTDVLPTIAAVLDSALPWPVEGHTVFDQAGALAGPLPYGEPGDPLMPFDVRQEAQAPERLRRQQLLVGQASLPGLSRTLIGTAVTAANPAAGPPLRVVSDNYLSFQRVDPASGVVPALVHGQIDGEGPPQLDLAIAVNGVVRAVTRTVVWRGTPRYFATLVPEDALHAGQNRLDVFRIAPPPGGSALVHLPAAIGTVLTWAVDDAAALGTPDGRRIPLGTDVASSIDRIEVTPTSLLVLGWAVDVRNKEPLETVVAFAGRTMVASGPVNGVRADVCAALGLPADMKTGFALELPIARLHAGDIRIAAISTRGAAGRLQPGASADLLARYR